MHGTWVQRLPSHNALIGSIILLILLGLLAAPAAANGALPDAVRVDATYNGTTPDYGDLNFSSIQDGVNGVAEGGTVSVAAGTYEEWVHIQRPVSLIADAGAVIDAAGQGIGILIDAESVSVEGFIVTGPTTFGIVVNGFDGAEVRNNVVTVVSDETTIEAPVGIYLYGSGGHRSSGHIVTGNTVTLESSLAMHAGIVAWEVTDTIVVENRISINSTYVEEGAGITALAAPSGASWGSGARKVPVKATVSALEDEGVSIRSFGIVADGNGIVVDENTIEVVAECLGDGNAGVEYQVRAVGIDARQIDLVRVTNNRITVAGNATDYAYADGIWVWGASALVEGNTIDSTASAERVQPWGIHLYDSREGWVLNNNVTVTIFAGDWADTTYGILVEYSEKAQVTGNTVVYIAEIGRDGASSVNAGIEGICIDTCSESQVAGNDVAVETFIQATGDEIMFGSTGSDLSSIASTVYSDLTGESVSGWAEVIGVDIYESDEVWVIENEIATETYLVSADGGNVSRVTGAIWSTGLQVSETGNAVVSENTIHASLQARGVSTGLGENASAAYANLRSEVAGVLLYDTGDTVISENCVTVESAQAVAATTMAFGPVGEGLIQRLDADLAEDEMDANAFAASLDEEGMYTEAIRDYLNETAFARTRTNALAAGIHAATDGYAEIHENTVDVAIASNAMDFAMYRVVALEAVADARGLARGFGIIGPSDTYALIRANNVTVVSSGTLSGGAGEQEVSTQDAGARSQLRTAAHGIVGRGSSNDILDNTVAVTAMSNSDVVTLEAISGGYSAALSSMATRAVGIRVSAGDGYDNDVSGNTVEVLSVLAPVTNAQGISGHVLASTEGTATGIGIRAPGALIAGNTVDVLAQVDNATTVATEFSALGAVAESVAEANAIGIVTRRAIIKGNNVSAEGIATATVVAETEELLENADAFGLVTGTGIGIDDRGRSVMTRNTVEGDGEAARYAYARGYRAETFGTAFGEGLSIWTEGGTATYNNIAGPMLGDYYYVDDTPRVPTHAAYNWWGDASGPSGYGPGTGSPLWGIVYSSDPMTWEPWLTRPFEDVVKENRAYLGIELRPDNGLSRGWNTFSVPIALEDNTWSAISSMGEGLNYSIAYTWDAAGQRWVQVLPSTRLSPLDAVYVRMNEGARLPIAVSPENTNPPQKILRAGWNLIGPAYAFDPGNLTWSEKTVDEALISVEKTPAGLAGYTVVLSPSINDRAWTYTFGANNPPTMETGYGYWIFMENPDTLAGYSTTPLLRLPDPDSLGILL